MDIAARLKAARTALGLKQDDMASQSGVSYSVYQKYEMGRSVPGGDAISGFIRLGINANWLLAEEGPMLMADLVPKPPPAPRINSAALGVMLEAARIAHPKMEPARQAAMAAEFYAISVEEGTVTADGIHPPEQIKAA